MSERPIIFVKKKLFSDSTRHFQGCETSAFNQNNSIFQNNVKLKCPFDTEICFKQFKWQRQRFALQGNFPEVLSKTNEIQIPMEGFHLNKVVRLEGYNVNKIDLFHSYNSRILEKSQYNNIKQDTQVLKRLCGYLYQYKIHWSGWKNHLQVRHQPGCFSRDLNKNTI